jgi:sarcosine oxidase subunit gamma
LKKRSPLEGFEFPAGLREVPFLAQINLRADPSAAGAMARLTSALGFALPVEPNTAAGGAEQLALWLGPDEWLVLGPPGAEAALEARCRAALRSDIGSVVDVSANRTTLELWGPAARAVLETGCAIDLHARAFGPGRCAQTLVARTGVILHQLTSEPCYRLLVRPSFSAYLASWLRDAMPDPTSDDDRPQPIA